MYRRQCFCLLLYFLPICRSSFFLSFFFLYFFFLPFDELLLNSIPIHWNGKYTIFTGIFCQSCITQVILPARLTLEKRLFNQLTLSIIEINIWTLNRTTYIAHVVQGTWFRNVPRLKFEMRLKFLFVLRVVNRSYPLTGIYECIHSRCGLTLSKCAFSSFIKRSGRTKISTWFLGIFPWKMGGPRGCSKPDHGH